MRRFRGRSTVNFPPPCFALFAAAIQSRWAVRSCRNRAAGSMASHGPVVSTYVGARFPVAPQYWHVLMDDEPPSERPELLFLHVDRSGSWGDESSES